MQRTLIMQHTSYLPLLLWSIYKPLGEYISEFSSQLPHYWYQPLRVGNLSLGTNKTVILFFLKRINVCYYLCFINYAEVFNIHVTKVGSFTVYLNFLLLLFSTRTYVQDLFSVNQIS